MKYIKTIFLFVAAAVFILYACEKPTEYRKYLSYGQSVNPGKAANLTAYGGLGRLKVVWGPQADPSVTKYVIYWDNGAKKDSMTYTATASGTGGVESVIINNLSETDLYTITIYAYDTAGNRSIPMSLQNAVVYGSEYISNLSNRRIISATTPIKTNGDTAYVKWGDPGITLRTKLSYVNRSGVSKTIYVEPGQTETILPDIAPQTRLSYQSSAIPVTNSPDTIYTAKADTATVYYDPTGNYTSNGYVYHPSAPRSVTDLEKEITKIGENQYKVDFGDLGGSGYAAVLTFDPATGNFTVSAAPGAAGAPYTSFPDGLPASNPGYTPQWAGSAQCNNTFDAATKTFRLRYGYMGGTGWRVTEEFIKLGSAYTLLDKSMIRALKLPGDATDGHPVGSYANLFDGDPNTMWASGGATEDLYSLVMSFDLGAAAPIGRFKINERTNCCQERSPKDFQIWATNDITTGASTISIKNGLAAWEADATAKGWVKLLDVKGNTTTSPDVSIPNTTSYRYVRYVGIASINGESDANYGEFTFWKRN